MEPLRIYVCGAHSTGKTTLARHLAQELGLPLINEVARQVMAEMELSFETLRVDLRQVSQYQREVFRRQIHVEERFPEGFVSDRAFCNLAYAARHSNALPDLLASQEAQDYFVHLRRNGLVFYVRPHRECMQDDGFRERVAWDEINRIDGILDFVFSWQQIPCIGIGELNMKDRVRTAMTAVRLYQRSLQARPQPLVPSLTPRSLEPQFIQAGEARKALKARSGNGNVSHGSPHGAVSSGANGSSANGSGSNGSGSNGSSSNGSSSNGSSSNGSSSNGKGKLDQPVHERVPLSALWSDLG